MRDRPWLLARHAETEWNAAGRLQGREDAPLTARGRAQAAELAAFALALGVRHVATSPLGRARATAAEVVSACAAGESVHDALVELSFGRCAGRTLEQVRRDLPLWWAARESDRWRVRWPEGESYADAAERLAAWLAGRPLAHAPEPVLVVAHQSVLRALLVALAGWPVPDALGVRFDACQVWRLAPAGACVRLLPEATPQVPA